MIEWRGASVRLMCFETSHDFNCCGSFGGVLMPQVGDEGVEPLGNLLVDVIAFTFLDGMA